MNILKIVKKEPHTYYIYEIKGFSIHFFFDRKGENIALGMLYQGKMAAFWQIFRYKTGTGKGLYINCGGKMLFFVKKFCGRATGFDIFCDNRVLLLQ